MVLTPPWLRIALDEAERGVDEIEGADHNPRIVEYHQATTLRATEDEVPWCSSFVNWSLQQCGYSGTLKANARSFLNWGTLINPPAYGCIVVLKRGNSSWQGHVGFLLYQDTPTSILVLGGNQSNAVNVRPYATGKVLGYRWPSL